MAVSDASSIPAGREQGNHVLVKGTSDTTLARLITNISMFSSNSYIILKIICIYSTSGFCRTHDLEKRLEQ